MSSSKKVSIKTNAEPNEQPDEQPDEQYNKQVKRFFELKNKWEKRKNKKQTNCLICNNLTTTMIFEVSRDLYLAKCGKKTCPSIEIARKTFISMEDNIQQMRDKLDKLKRKFIIEKMDTMFKFIDDKNAIKVFKNEFEEYRELLKVYNQYNLENKNQNKIDELNTKIYDERLEIMKLREIDYTPQQIEDIIDIVNNKLTPLIGELQELTYPIMEMNITKTGDIKLYQKSEIPRYHAIS